MGIKECENQHYIILGETVIALLAEQQHVTNAGLLEKLYELLEAEGVTWRKAAIQSVIRNITDANSLRKTENGS